jgi:hypothetical protein
MAISVEVGLSLSFDVPSPIFSSGTPFFCLSKIKPAKVISDTSNKLSGMESPRNSVPRTRKNTCFNLKGNCVPALERYSPGRNRKKNPNHIKRFIAREAFVAVGFLASFVACFSSARGKGRTRLAAGSSFFQLFSSRVKQKSIVPGAYRFILGSNIPNVEKA